MNGDDISDHVHYERGYRKGFSAAEKQILEKFDKLLLKAKTEAYDKGYQAGANQKDNDPCVCGFWGKKK
tara:strand:+ start:170 stop:376 length:207 start_codon:yes stop_codon:yes gene_type:complete